MELDVLDVAAFNRFNKINGLAKVLETYGLGIGRSRAPVC
jgi:hypothetical protein